MSDNQDRIQCEHIAEQVWIHLSHINQQADLAGQVQQCGYAVKDEFVRLVADIIQKELGR